MLNIKIVTTDSRMNVMADMNQRVADFMQEHGINAGNGQTTLNGIMAGVADMNKTFAELGYREDETIVLANVAKHDNA